LTNRPTTPPESIQRQTKCYTPMDPKAVKALISAQFSATKVINYMAKAAIKAIVDVITERATNQELFEAIKCKKACSKRIIANLGKAQVMSMVVVKERRKVLNEKLFKKESQYLNAISFSIFDDVIRGSPKKSTQKKPIASIKPVPCVILALSLDLTSTLATISTIAKELEVTTLKSPVIASKSSIAVPYTVPTTTRSGRVIKRRGGQ
jgi:hypothetical protein